MTSRRVDPDGANGHYVKLNVYWEGHTANTHSSSSSKLLITCCGARYTKTRIILVNIWWHLLQKNIHCISDSRATTVWFQFWEISIDHEEGIVP